MDFLITIVYAYDLRLLLSQKNRELEEKKDDGRWTLVPKILGATRNINPNLRLRVDETFQWQLERLTKLDDAAENSGAVWAPHKIDIKAYF